MENEGGCDSCQAHLRKPRAAKGGGSCEHSWRTDRPQKALAELTLEKKNRLRTHSERKKRKKTGMKLSYGKKLVEISPDETPNSQGVKLGKSERTSAYGRNRNETKMATCLI